MTDTNKRVYCTFQIEGIHFWPNVPDGPVEFLRDRHRHVFNFRVDMGVEGNNRSIEFITLKRDCIDFLFGHFELYKLEETPLCLDFGSLSCEQIATVLSDQLIGVSRGLQYVKVEVSEDGENGGWIEFIPSSDIDRDKV